MIKFNVATINRCTEAEGPYKRLAIWFQGCDLRCKGCCNPDYQALVPKHLISLEELVNAIRESKEAYGIEGVTYVGGEPTLQQNLPLLTQEIKKLGLGVISFTGHLFEQVRDRLEGCDMVMDGEYDGTKPETLRKLVGSTNQRIIYLTDRYKNCDQWLNTPAEKRVEFNVGDHIFANGDKVL